MNDDQKLAVLDRRAAAATAALDEAVEQVPVPEPDFGAPRRSVRRFLPLAVAAGLAVIALVGAALVFDDDEQSTIAEQPGGITRLALPDPETLGYRIVGAFDGENPDDRLPRDLVTPVTIQSPAGAEDPWTTTVVSYSLSTDMTTLDGEPVDVGGPEATLDSSNGPLTVGWIDEPRVHYLRSASMSAGELVALARSAVAERTADGEPLPGHQIVYAGPHTDVFPVLASATAAAASRLDGLVYESDDGGFVVATGEGSHDRWRASHALAVDTTRITVRGHEAIHADYGDGLSEVSWLEPDGTLVRVDSLRDPIPVEDLDHLEPITEADFEALVEMSAARGSGESGDVFDPNVPDGPETTLAEARLEDGAISVRATLLRRGDDLVIEVDTQDSEGGGGVGQSLPDTASNVVVRDEHASTDWSAVVLGGVIGPRVQIVEVIDSASGTVVGSAYTATIEDSNHVVFLATISHDHRNADLVVVGTTAAGEEIRLDAPVL